MEASPRKHEDSPTKRQADFFDAEYQLGLFQTKVKNRILDQVHSKKKPFSFKISGRAFAKTLQERTLKQPSFLQGLESKEQPKPETLGTHERLLQTPGGFLGIVLKNSTFIQSVLLNEVVHQGWWMQESSPSPLHLQLFIRKSAYLQDVVQEKGCLVRNVINTENLFDPKGVLVALLFHYSLKHQVSPLALKLKFERTKQQASLIRQNYKEGIYLQGIKLKNATINP